MPWWNFVKIWYIFRDILLTYLSGNSASNLCSVQKRRLFTYVIFIFIGYPGSNLRNKFVLINLELFCYKMASNATVKCPPLMKATSNGVFQGDNPLHFALPLLILQICLVVVLTRVLAYLLRPLRQPRVIAEIIVSFSLFYHLMKFPYGSVYDYLWWI